MALGIAAAAALKSASYQLVSQRGQMQPIRIGNFEVSRVADFEGPSFDPCEFFPDFDPEVVRANADLLGPRLVDPASGKLVFSFHSFVVRTGRHNILIDSCIGNDKERPARPQWHHMHTPYIEDLARVGVGVEDIDFVMCTHLHWDHVGWNTRLADGKWVPTFPKARYIMAQREFDHWKKCARQRRRHAARHRLRRQHPAGRRDRPGAAGRRRLSRSMTGCGSSPIPATRRGMS